MFTMDILSMEPFLRVYNVHFIIRDAISLKMYFKIKRVRDAKISRKSRNL